MGLRSPGIIGAFCRAYSITEAIAEFELPYTVSGQDGTNPRYTYLEGSAGNGAVVYDDDTALWSNYATDPVSQRYVNAFDVVRLHLSANLEGQKDEDDNLR